MRSEKNTATLSIVRNMTNNCLLRLGMNLTSFNILSNRKVLNTERPESAWLSPVKFLNSSMALETTKESKFPRIIFHKI